MSGTKSVSSQQEGLGKEVQLLGKILRINWSGRIAPLSTGELSQGLNQYVYNRLMCFNSISSPQQRKMCWGGV